jgi:hypothetical protein
MEPPHFKIATTETPVPKRERNVAFRIRPRFCYTINPFHKGRTRFVRALNNFTPSCVVHDCHSMHGRRSRSEQS